jgi:hypothetical protein
MSLRARILLQARHIGEIRQFPLVAA